MNASLLLAIGAILIFLFVFLYFVPIGLVVHGFGVWSANKYCTIVLMRIRKVPPSLIINAQINSVKAGLNTGVNDLETHYMAGGNVNNVIKALISADKANIPLDFNLAAAIDLAGRDVFDAVQLSVNPRVINTPPVAAVAKDGIQLIAKARVTVRANIHQLVGGAGEETILARVGEGIVTTIGSATDHKSVLGKSRSNF